LISISRRRQSALRRCRRRAWASFGRRGIGITAATITFGSRAVGFMSAMDIIGSLTVGNNAGRIGTTSRDIGSAKFPIDGLKELRRGLLRDAPQFFY
jgi:hypothetical protein